MKLLLFYLFFALLSLAVAISGMKFYSKDGFLVHILCFKCIIYKVVVMFFFTYQFDLNYVILNY